MKAKRKKTVNLLYLFLVTIILLGHLVAAEKQDLSKEIRKLEQEISKVKKDNKKLDRDISRTDSLKAEEAASFKIMENNFSLDLKRRQKEIADLKEKMEGLKQKIRQEKQKQSRYKNSIGEVIAKEKAILEVLIEQCDILEDEISKSIPWEKQQRIERVNVLRRDLKSASASHEEGLNRLNTLYAEEIKAGDEVALLQKSVTRNNGEIINASVLRIGNQWLVYADEESKYYGVLQRNKADENINYSWREDLSFTEREAIRNALDVKMAKKPPTLVTLPLTLSLQTSTTASTPDDKKGGAK
ncbi:MAG: DUF3450 family protein [Fibrobacteria bacterium]|nr:DUF3450 family protein [Fibrobacteria bacterium]